MDKKRFYTTYHNHKKNLERPGVTICDPARNLLAAITVQALYDFYQGSPVEKLEAYLWLESDGALYTEACGLNKTPIELITEPTN